jgi:hypothetical protein
MSALPPIADIRQRIEYVCFVPLTDIAALSFWFCPNGIEAGDRFLEGFLRRCFLIRNYAIPKSFSIRFSKRIGLS